MLLTKFCTICNCEYSGDTCPNCSGIKPAEKVEHKKKKHNKPKAMRHFAQENDADFQKKLKELVDKYNERID